MKPRAIFAGTFDPPTLGHLDVVLRMAPLFEKFFVVIAANTTKKSLLTIDVRVELLKTTLANAGLINCEVKVWGGLMPVVCKAWGVEYLVRGVRGPHDLEQEFSLANANAHYSGAKTLLSPAPKEHLYTSSTLVRHLYELGGDVSAFVPACVNSHLLQSSALKGPGKNASNPIIETTTG